MATGIFGYFRFTQDGVQLRGSYMNWNTAGLQPETAARITQEVDRFVGTYETTWTDTAARTATLIITLQNDQTFLLNWINVSNTDVPVNYRGRGTVHKEELSGFYELID